LDLLVGIEIDPAVFEEQLVRADARQIATTAKAAPHIPFSPRVNVMASPSPFRLLDLDRIANARVRGMPLLSPKSEVEKPRHRGQGLLRRNAGIVGLAKYSLARLATSR
jgi:hypothetical protein